MHESQSALYEQAVRELAVLQRVQKDPAYLAQKEVIENLVTKAAKVISRLKNDTIPCVCPNPRTGLPFDKDRKFGTIFCNGHNYLPLPRHNCLQKVGRLNFIFPRALLLGDLFSSVIPEDAVCRSTWTTQETYTQFLVQTQGHQLRTIDRRVICAILTYAARKNLAFSEKKPDSASITCSLNYLIEHILGSSDSAGRRAAVMSSLQRLSETRIKVKENNQDLLTLPCMIRLMPAPDGSSKLHIQIPAEWVHFFKRGKWTTIHADIAHLDDLTGWLAYFYACHSQPYDVDVEKLKTFCGRRAARPNEFQAALQQALSNLSSTTLPADVRISSVGTVYDGRALKTIKVSLLAWDERRNAKTQVS